MSYQRAKAPWYGIGFFVTPSPSVSDPAAMYRWSVCLYFWHWSKFFHFGRLA